MAPNKFEEQIKEKLEQRSLTPSTEGWSKLSERLDKENKSSKNAMYWWLGIAAGLVIFLAVSLQFFNNDNSESVMPQIVNEQKEEVKQEEPQTEIHTIKINDLAIEDDKVEGEKEKAKSINKSNIQPYKNVSEQLQEKKIQVAEINKSIKEKTKPKNSEASNDIMQEKANTLLMKDAMTTTMQDLKTQNSQVTNREIDSLLKVANKELLKIKLQKETTKMVEAEALLRSVEDDMGQSFRSKVFEALKDSYESVKTAVAERNN
ncbi:MAG: hypothetical protein HKN40_00760 [Winogradskyella sp.]|uniref:hypothetical protein n=1 Tax=Winogradskyella sp. TaxID=1883156 RepID=UPI0017DC31BA|nr:hypothetical protein [Winogradskyella sp.]